MWIVDSTFHNPQSTIHNPMSDLRRYPDRPMVGVGAIIVEGDRVLLVERGQQPQKGCWSLPGGLVEIGEHL